MKKAFLIILICFSCDVISYTDYKIINDSSYNIKIEAYYNKKKYDSIEIITKKEFSVPDIYDGRGGVKSVFSNQNVIEYARDSVVIIFDNKKVIKQACGGKDLRMCGDIEKNIANIAFDSRNLSNGNSRKGLKKYVGPLIITFNDSDYQRATPL